MNRRSFLQRCAGALAAAVIPLATSAQPAAITPAPPLPNQGEAVPAPEDDGWVQTESGFWVTKEYKLGHETLLVKREPFHLEFFAYETLGGCLGSPASFA